MTALDAVSHLSLFDYGRFLIACLTDVDESVMLFRVSSLNLNENVLVQLALEILIHCISSLGNDFL